MKKLSAVILSAGYSSRMKAFKPLMSFGVKTAVRLLYDTYRECNIEDIIIVTGFNAEKLIEDNKDLKVKWVFNPDFNRGMYSSIKAAVNKIDKNSRGFFLNPVDIPVIKKRTIYDLISEFDKDKKGIIYPVFNGKRGHPPIISTRYKNIIIEYEGFGGLKELLEKYEQDFTEVPVSDRGTVMDMDTPEDYRKLAEYYNSCNKKDEAESNDNLEAAESDIIYNLKNIPDEEECRAILKKYKVPQNVINHQEAVADIAVSIGEKLKAAGYYVDIDKIKAAALLHDIGRLEKDHAAAGTRILRNLGYDDLAEIVSVHMDIQVSDETKITEKEIIYLADKLTDEDKTVTLDERFKKAIDKFKDNQDAMNNIKTRFENAVKIQEKIRNLSATQFTVHFLK